ncbi:MAG: class I SAM-dependent methyltransferase [Planctomycetia bacterium]|nr:class I SAM-dependent methyltransferase [Planctomycetia bacterium]
MALQGLRGLVKDAVAEALGNDSVNFSRERLRLASRETAQFVNQHMANTPAFPERFALLKHSVQSVDPKLQGLYCEFGVATGGTINFIAEQTPHEVHGFDSFEGLPDDWVTGRAKGSFAQLGLPKVRDNVRLHKGWFNESLPGWKQKHAGPIAFMHLDADLYSSTKTVLDLLGDQLVPGTIIQFDEYFNYPGWKEHEYKAFQEFVEARQVKFEYIGYTTGGIDPCQVAVRILAVGTPGK